MLLAHGVGEFLLRSKLGGSADGEPGTAGVRHHPEAGLCRRLLPPPPPPPLSLLFLFLRERSSSWVGSFSYYLSVWCCFLLLVLEPWPESHCWILHVTHCLFNLHPQDTAPCHQSMVVWPSCPLLPALCPMGAVAETPSASHCLGILSNQPWLPTLAQESLAQRHP